MKRPHYVLTLTDEAWNACGIAERALHVARSQDAVQEFPRGANIGPVVSVYLKLAGILGPAPWCAAFVYWCLIQAGAAKADLPRNPASTLSWLNWALKKGKVTKIPSRGGLFVWNKNGKGHIGFVRAVDLAHKSVSTLEGNSNSNGSREGYMVAENTRSIATVTGMVNGGFIDLRWLQ